VVLELGTAGDPDGSARLRARRVSLWKGTWVADLEGTLVEVEKFGGDGGGGGGD
jgi:hypothetical protein